MQKVPSLMCLVKPEEPRRQLGAEREILQSAETAIFAGNVGLALEWFEERESGGDKKKREFAGLAFYLNIWKDLLHPIFNK